MENKGLKIAISGKGGVGKTTLSSLLCKVFAKEGREVLAVDADPDANLGIALGFTPEELQKVKAISEDKAMIKEKTGAEPGMSGQMFTLNPSVEDIPERYVVEKAGVKLMRMGKVVKGGAGCACPESVLIKHLLLHLVLKANEVVVVDMEAGLEHLGRGTAVGVDAFIVVVEPGKRSFQTAQSVVELAKDLGVKQVFGVANKVRPGDEEVIRQNLDFMPILGFIPYNPDIVSADLAGESVYDKVAGMAKVGEEIKDILVKTISQ